VTIISDREMKRKPGEKDAWLIEDGARGDGRLVGRITPAGARSFYFRYTSSAGERVRLLIGPYDPNGDGRGSFTVQQARSRARELSSLYRTGAKDLREHLQLLAQSQVEAETTSKAAEVERMRQLALEAERRLTVRQVFQRWRETELQPTTRADGKRTGRKDGGTYVHQQFERHVFPAMGDRPIAEVRKADVLALIDAQKADGKLRTAAVILSDLRQMMAFALDRELIDSDPLASIKKSRVVGTAVERTRVLAEAEIKTLALAIPAARMSKRSALAIRLLLATGARVGELMGAVWREALPDQPVEQRNALEGLQSLADSDGVKVGIVDLAKRTWYLQDTKNQRSHSIHLSEFAVKQFEALSALREKAQGTDSSAPWVFPARDNMYPVCVKSFGKQLSDRQRTPEQRMSGRSKATEALRLPGGRWTAHDLRRTTATLMASLGVSGDVVDECLNHMMESRMRRVYIHDRREREQAAAFESLGKKLSALMTKTTPGKAGSSNQMSKRVMSRS
jgi:integrase